MLIIAVSDDRDFWRDIADKIRGVALFSSVMWIFQHIVFLLISLEPGCDRLLLDIARKQPLIVPAEHFDDQ